MKCSKPMARGRKIPVWQDLLRDHSHHGSDRRGRDRETNLASREGRWPCRSGIGGRPIDLKPKIFITGKLTMAGSNRPHVFLPYGRFSDRRGSADFAPFRSIFSIFAAPPA